MHEQLIWKGHPSQVLIFGKHLLGLLLVAGVCTGGCFFTPIFFALPLPLLWILWNYLTVRCQVYELSDERLRIHTGVLNKTIDEIELYRVKDTSMQLPLWLRIFGLCTLHLDTSDRSHPKVDIVAISDGVRLLENIRKQVEILRDKKRVREVDFEEGDQEMLT